MSENGIKLISNNKKAYYEYFIEDTYEAGISLSGTEVKSVRLGKCSIKEAYVHIKNDGAYIERMNITPYEMGNIFNKDPIRTRRLLLHKYEINKLRGSASIEGYTIVPLRVYIKKNLVKVEIGLAKGKKLYDKRRDIAAKDMKREAQKENKLSNRQIRF